MDLLLISNDFESHYVYIKDFDRFIFNKTKYKRKKYFCRNYLQCFSSDKLLNEHRIDCLVVNGKQNIKLESGFISGFITNIFRVVLLTRSCVLMINIVRVLFCIEEKMLFLNLLNQFLVSIIITGK